MNALTLLSNAEKGKLLHQLFPEEIQGAVDFLEGLCATILEDEEHNRQSWNNFLIDFDSFLKLLKKVQSNIEENKEKVCRSSQLFALLLFEWQLAVFSAYGLMLYVTTQQHPNEKFASMIKVLFG